MVSTGDRPKNVVEELSERASELFDPCFRLVIEQTADYLFTLSASHRLDRENQDRCFDAFTALQQSSKNIVDRMKSDLITNWQLVRPEERSEVPPPSGYQENNDHELRLVDLDEFEDTLAIEKIVRVSTERFWLPLEAISIRLSEFLGCDAASLYLPISPRAICVSYRSALRTIEFPRQFLVDADSAFVRQLLPELQGIYSELALLLANSGLSPELESTLEITGSQFLIARAGGSKHPTRGEVTDQESTRRSKKVSLEVSGNDRAVVLPEDLSKLALQLIDKPETVQALMAQGGLLFGTSQLIGSSKRLTEAASESQMLAADQDSNFTPERLKISGLTEGLRDRSLARPASLLKVQSREEVDARDSDLLLVRDALAQLRQSGDLSSIDPSGLTAAMDLTLGELAIERIEETAKLTSSLIQFVEIRLSCGELLSQETTSLKLMLIELALVDDDFLLTSNHPGRLFLDRLVEYATLITPGDQNAIKTLAELLNELQEIFTGDASAFETAVSTLEPLTIRLIKLKKQNVERVISRETAREVRQRANKALKRALNQTTSMPCATKEVTELLDAGLADALILKLLQGATEDDIKKMLQPLSILWDLEAIDAKLQLTGEHHDSVKAGVEAILGIEQERSASLNSAIETMLTQAAKGKLTKIEGAIWEITVDQTSSEQTEALRNRPRLRRKVETIRRLPMRSWVSVVKKGVGDQFLQLVWKNTDSSRLVFTDERGKMRMALSALEIGSKMNRSVHILSASQQLTLVEQTLFGRLKDAQSVLIDTSTSPLTGVDVQLTDIERHLRRAKRKGTTQSLLVANQPNTKTVTIIKEALATRSVSVAALHSGTVGVGTLIVDCTDRNILDPLIEQLQAEIGCQITCHELAGDIADARRLLTNKAAKQTPDPTADALSSEPPQIDYRPIALTDAVNQTLIRLQQQLRPDSGVLPMFRIPLSKTEKVEASALVTVDGAPDFSGQEDSRADLFLQTDVIIAFDLYKVASACQLLTMAQDMGKALPNIHVKLSAETCLYANAVEDLLSMISDAGVGTEYLHFELRDSLHIRLSKSAKELAEALRSIGCKIVITDLNPARGDPVPLQRLRPHSILFDSDFWHNAAAEEPWYSLLPTIITDVYHLLDESVGLRNPTSSDRLESVGIDYIERVDDQALSIDAYLSELPSSGIN